MRAVAAFALVLTGCGFVSPVLPPLLDIPVQIPSITAVEYGGRILVQFNQPDLTTEGNPLKGLRSLEVRVGEPVTPFNAEVWASKAKAYPVTPPVPGAVTQEIPAADWAGKQVAISARAVGPRGKASGWATVKLLRVDAPLATPAGLKAENVEQGVRLRWSGGAGKYRIYRAIAGAQPEVIGEAQTAEYLDPSTQYDKTYEYRVQAVTDELHGSEVSAAEKVTTVDTFPPAVPGALTAILGANSVELTWTRNTEPDFRGYNVYRAVEGGEFTKIAGLVAAPSYSDLKVEAGKRYRYAVTSVDAKGNESARSTVAEAAVQ